MSIFGSFQKWFQLILFSLKNQFHFSVSFAHWIILNCTLNMMNVKLLGPWILLFFSSYCFFPFCFISWLIKLKLQTLVLGQPFWSWFISFVFSWAVLSECVVHGSIRSECRQIWDILSCKEFSEFSFLNLQATHTALSAQRCRPCHTAHHVVFTQPQDKSCKNENLILYTSPCLNVYFQSGSVCCSSFSSTSEMLGFVLCPDFIAVFCKGLGREDLTESLPFPVYLNHC